jgi:hypothetical protein
MKLFGRVITYPLSYGAITPLYAGTSPAAAELNGKVGGIPVPRIAREWPVDLTRKRILFFLVSYCLGTRHAST